MNYYQKELNWIIIQREIMFFWQTTSKIGYETELICNIPTSV